MMRMLCLCACLVLPGLSACGEADEPVELGDPDCDPLVPAECALPWPSNQYLVPDAARKTGYTLTFGARTLPKNSQQVPIDPMAYRKLDGYSLGTPLMAIFPGADLSAMPTEDRIERSLEPGAQVLWFEVQGQALRRVPCFVELDPRADEPARQVLLVRPAVILKEATRYVVAFRDLKDQSGAPLPRSPAFQRLVRGRTADLPALAARQARFDQIFALLESQGVPRESLTLAWDFVTASSEALHGDLLRMRDDALARVGPTGPALTIDKVTEFTAQQNADIALELEGTVTVPSYLDTVMMGGFAYDRIRRDAMGRPRAEGTRTPRFWVRVPRSALAGPPQGLVLYGHGLLGSGTQVRGGFNSRIANQYGLIFFAADLYGMSEVDRLPVVSILQDLGRFPSMSNRLHQGVLEWVVLARAVRDRLGELEDLKKRGIRVNREELFYSGISQGGIFGGTFMAVSPDVTYGHLGVPGNNYSLLLARSVDFTSYFQLLDTAYGTPAQQQIALAAVQLHWESVDPVSHLRHISAEPHPGNKPHHVLIAPAKGDWQVAVLANEIAARSEIGIALLKSYDNERTPWGIPQVSYPHRGSGVVLYHFGNPWPPIGAQPPKDSIGDPHEKPRRWDPHNRQMVTFFRTGEIIDVCGGSICKPPN